MHITHTHKHSEIERAIYTFCSFGRIILLHVWCVYDEVYVSVHTMSNMHLFFMQRTFIQCRTVVHIPILAISLKERVSKWRAARWLAVGSVGQGRGGACSNDETNITKEMRSVFKWVKDHRYHIICALQLYSTHTHTHTIYGIKIYDENQESELKTKRGLASEKYQIFFFLLVGFCFWVLLLHLLFVVFASRLILYLTYVFVCVHACAGVTF